MNNVTNDARQNLDGENFRLLKDRLYRAVNALQLSVEGCPRLEKVYIELPDGHKLYAHEVFSWLGAVRSDCWKYGPPDVQMRHIKNILKDKPKG
jgi:hypothetical protein